MVVCDTTFEALWSVGAWSAQCQGKILSITEGDQIVHDLRGRFPNTTSVSSVVIPSPSGCFK